MSARGSSRAVAALALRSPAATASVPGPALTHADADMAAINSTATPARATTELLGQRVRPHLELHQLAQRPPAAFHVKWRARRDARPDALPFPPSSRIVDAAVDALRVEAHGIRDAER